MDAPKDFDFTKGGQVGKMLFPALRAMDQAKKIASKDVACEFIVYEPGNGTRYEVFLGRRQAILAREFLDETDEWYPLAFISIMNFGRPCSMALSGKPLSLVSIDHICAKMGVMAGDAYALIPLINDFLARH